ncbi:MAG: ABC transporter substrate-binding protein [Lachnospiraceae bacterium]
MKNKNLFLVLCLTFLLCFGIVSSMYFIKEHRENLNKLEETKKTITVGFSQVGAESDWRTANSISIKEAFSVQKGYDLIFSDAQQKQEKQIMAIRSFIQQGVDYIILAPVTETGWDTVLKEAKDADIPVIIIDRMVQVEDDDLYTAWIGSDFYQQGKNLCDSLQKYLEEEGIKEVNIAHIQGTIGASAQIGRTRALEEAAKENGWNIVEQQSGDFTQTRAQEVMKSMLNQNNNINVVYCENDNEAFGAMEAISATGKTLGPGGDILIVSFDATKEALSYVLNGEILIDAECNPLQGPRVENLIQQLESGDTPPKKFYIDEQIFIYENVTSETVQNRKY